MSEIIAIVGDTGTGKTASLESLTPSTTAMCNVVGKPLSFRGWKKNYTPFKGDTGNYLASDDYKVILKFMKHISDSRPEITELVIDDGQYLMSNEFMKRSSEKGYEKFTELAYHMWLVITEAAKLREDLKVIFLMHDEQLINKDDFTTMRKIKTIGKMLDDKITLEGLFTIVLFTTVEHSDKGNKYQFMTQTDGTTRAKSPREMFSELLIPNDMKMVVDTIDEYYG